MVEHKIEKLVAYSDKLLLLVDGKQIDYAPADKLFSRDDIEQYQIDIPIYTKIAKAFHKKLPTGYYPTTLADLTKLFN